ncbi:hypothetical protein AHAS_Ahas20G0160500 [Arachis hypogaea]
MEFNSSFDQTNFMGYCPPSPNDYSNGCWEDHQEMTDYEQSNQWGYAPEPQNDQDNFMGYCQTPQNDSCHYANALNVSYSINQVPSSLEQSFNSFMLNCPTSPPSFSLENSSPLEYASAQNSFHTSQNDFITIPTYPETHS